MKRLTMLVAAVALGLSACGALFEGGPGNVATNSNRAGAPRALQATDVQRAVLDAVQGEMHAKEVLLDPRVLVWWDPEEHETRGLWKIEFYGEHPSDMVAALRASETVQGTCEDSHHTGTLPTCDLEQNQVVVALSAPRSVDETIVEVSALLSGRAQPRASGRENPWARQEIYRLEKQAGEWVITSRRTIVQT
jgi:hypothetical protein